MTPEARRTDRPRTGGPVVVAGVDGAPGSVEVLRAAARLAEIAHGSIAVAHVVPRLLGAQIAVAYDDSTLAEIEADLFPDVVEALLDTPVEWTLTTLVGNPAYELKNFAQAQGAAGIVVGADTPGWSSHLRRFSTGSVPSRLVHEQTVPVVVIPTACAKAPRPQH